MAMQNAPHAWVTDGPGHRVCDGCGAAQTRSSAGIWSPQYPPLCPRLWWDPDEGRDKPRDNKPRGPKPKPSDDGDKLPIDEKEKELVNA